jgi:hypothetical protein
VSNTESDFTEHHDLGYFGNIWVRQNVLPKAGNIFDGHRHHFDHVTLLVRGSVEVEVDGHPPKTFTAPTFVVIRKDHKHKVTALEDDVLFYCVFALRDVDGEVFDPVYSSKHDPLCATAKPEPQPEQLQTLQKLHDKTHDFT